MKTKKILFLSALDFKEKSIQVIRKTPEAYAQAGWDVYYVVARDTSKSGNYFYENEINPPGIIVHRFYMPFVRFYDCINNHLLRTIFSKIRGYIVIIKLAIYANRILKNNEVDVVYGYEMHGVLAVNFLGLFRNLRKVKVVSRFQGTLLKEKEKIKSILNWDGVLALYLPSDLCIMTDDGTQGDKFLKFIKSKNLQNYKFWVNGVDEQKMPLVMSEHLRQQLGVKADAIIAITVCRLESWKKVDRGLRLMAKVICDFNIKNILYIIVGDGSERGKLERLAYDLGIDKFVKFLGAIEHERVMSYLNVADFFISTYDFSNVGNPLLEAIRSNKIIFTLNNGDTSSWIKHKVNGFIYDVNDDLIGNMAVDVKSLLGDVSLKQEILKNVKKTEKEKLWTWEKRLDAEVMEVEKLCNHS